MSESHEIFEAAARLTREGTPFVLITVIATKGSTPRDAGAKMIWRPLGAPAADRLAATPAVVNGAASGRRVGASSAAVASVQPSRDHAAAESLIGTVGGGQFEQMVIDAAERHLNHRSCGMEHYVLGADADQCCGGVMDVFFEYHGASRRLFIFGAGHVAKELADLLGPGSDSPLCVTIVDDRPSWNSAERFPHCRRLLDWDEGVRDLCRHPGESLACIMTCSHDTDFELLQSILRRAPIERGRGGATTGATDVPAFVGLIGSKSKRGCLFGRLVASGIDESLVQQVQCPIGVGDTGKAPRLVAISMAAKLLLEVRERAPVQ
ncbi:MAG: XdhC family protein [Phycisphaerales bacterium]